MNVDISFINGLVFGIAHTGNIFIEDEEEEEIFVAQGIVIALGIFQIVLYW